MSAGSSTSVVTLPGVLFRTNCAFCEYHNSSTGQDVYEFSRIGLGQEVFKYSYESSRIGSSRVGSSGVGSGHPLLDPTLPDLTGEVLSAPCRFQSSSSSSAPVSCGLCCNVLSCWFRRVSSPCFQSSFSQVSKNMCI